MTIDPIQIAKSINSQRSRTGGVSGDVGVALDALAEDLAVYFEDQCDGPFDPDVFLSTAGAK